MDTTPVRRTVEAALEHEREHQTLTRMVRGAHASRRPDASEQELDGLVRRTMEEIEGYVRGMVTLLDEAIAAADRAGVMEDMRPVFEVAVRYVQEDVDFIPNSLGLAGVVDDAYLVHGLVHEVCRRHEKETGKALLRDEHRAATARVRRMIGEPTSSRLDSAILALSRETDIEGTIARIIDRIGDSQMAMSLPVNMAFPSSDPEVPERTGEQRRAPDEPPELELGSLSRQ